MKAPKPLIDQLTAMIKEGYDLGKKEIPLIGQEILTYATWDSILSMSVCVMAMGALGGTAAYFAHLAMTPCSLYDRWNDNTGYWIGATLLGVLTFVPLGFFVDSASTYLKVKLAPRVFLLDKLRSYL